MRLNVVCIIAFLITFHCSLFSQTITEEIKAPPAVENADQVFVVAEQMPQFIGGDEAMYKFINESIIYPPEAAKQSLQGKVYIRFIIRKNGDISDVELVRGIKDGASLETEALRIIKSMPKWTPGYQKGKAINVQLILPVSFSLK